METIDYKGYKIEISEDNFCDNPNERENEDCFIVYDHRDFFVEKKGFNPVDIFDVFQKKNIYNGYHILPLYAYIHSGVALSLSRGKYPFNDRWDSSFKGFVLIKMQKGAWTKKQAYKCAQSVVEDWNMYLSGDVYFVNLIDESGEVFDCCGCCYGYENTLSDAKSQIDRLTKHETA